jgi:hypothetical protein
MPPKPANPVYKKSEDGNYYRQDDSSTPYYLGTDDRYHPLIRIVDTTAHFHAMRADFLSYMRARNNTFRNHMGQEVEFDQALVTPHASAAFEDPHSHSGAWHWTIQLSNGALRADGSSSHLLHWSPDRSDVATFYKAPITQCQVERNHGNKFAYRQKTKVIGKKGNTPIGGSGAAGL